METILKQLRDIAISLDSLSHMAMDLTENYYGDKFEEQNILASEIENLLIAVTHEMSSTIGFMCQDIQDKVNLFFIREKFPLLSNSDIETIVDADILPVQFKKNLVDKLGGYREYRDTIEGIRSQWIDLFKNKTYTKIANSKRK